MFQGCKTKGGNVNRTAAADHGKPGGSHRHDLTGSAEVGDAVHAGEQYGNRQDKPDIARHFQNKISRSQQRRSLVFQKFGEIVENVTDQEQQSECERQNGKRNQKLPQDVKIENRKPTERSAPVDRFQQKPFILCHIQIISLLLPFGADNIVQKS